MSEAGTEISLGTGEVALFGYGSLMLPESMERSLGHPYTGPYIDCELDGWRRTWNVAMPNETIIAEHQGERFAPARILYLDVRRDAGTRMNGVLFVVNAEELAAFDRREWIYERVPVRDALRGATVTGGEAFVYVGLPAYARCGAVSPREEAVRASYVAIIDEALRRRSAAFRAAYAASTDPPPAELIVREVEATLPRTTPRITSCGT